MRHAVIRTDNLAAPDMRVEMVSLRYDDAIDNGNIVRVGNLENGSRTVYKAHTPNSSDKLSDIAIIGSPEIIYDDRAKDLCSFFNKANKILRGYRLHEHDCVSITADAFSGTPRLGKSVGIGNGTKLVVTDDDGIGTIIDKNIVGKYTYWVVEIGGRKTGGGGDPTSNVVGIGRVGSMIVGGD